MNNPFAHHPAGTASISLSGMVDYWVEPTPDDATNNILDKESVEAVGVTITVGAAGTVAYHDRHGIARSQYLEPGQFWPTSVSRILATGTDATGVKVAIAP